MSGIDIWVIETMKELAKEAVKYMTIRELKRRLPEKIPQEKRNEFRKRLSNSFSMLRRSGKYILDKDILLKLSNYPGMIRFLQDEDFRKEYMKLDTGTGMVVLDESSKELLLTSRISVEHKLISCLKGWHMEYFSPTFSVSLPGTLADVESKVPGGEIRIKFEEERSRFENEIRRERLELEGKINTLINLEIPVMEYESQVKEILRKFADVLNKYLLEYNKLMGIISGISLESRRKIGYTLFSLHLRLMTLVSALDFMAKIYNLEWHGYGYWPMLSLEKLGKLVIKFLVH